MSKPTDTPGVSGQPTDEAGRDLDDHGISNLARRTLERKLGALPSPSDLDDDLLLRYVDGALSSSERATLERRLLVDLDAKERLGILAGGLSDTGHARPSVPEGMITRGAQAASRYVFHIASGLIELLRGGEGAAVLAPAAAVRSGLPVDASRPTAFQIDRLFQTAQGPLAARFELHAEVAEATPAALVDLVVHIGSGAEATDGMRVKLLRDGRPVDSRDVEASGCTFARLGPARYDVELRKGGVEVGRLTLDLRGDA